MSFKFGQVREDGLVYYCKQLNKEVWLTKEKFDERKNKRREYRRKCVKIYHSICKVKHKFGDYDAKRDLYFLGISSSGKPMWKSKERLEKRIALNRKSQRKLYNESKNLPKNNLTFGDPNPEDPNLFVIYKYGNKIYWGDKSKLEARKEKMKLWAAKSYIKNKKKREAKLQSIEKRFRKGTKHPESNLVFWRYSDCGNETWLSPEEYKIRFEREKINRSKFIVKKNIRQKQQREKRLAKVAVRIRRGTENPKSNLIFWRYNNIGKEVWIDKVEYKRRMDNIRLSYKKRMSKKL